MQMIFVTRVFRPEPKRLAGLGGNITFTRSIPLQQFLGFTIGGVIGLIFGLIAIQLPLISLVPFVFALAATTGLGAFAGIFLSNWSPWEGESLKTVIWVKSHAYRSQTKSICAGSLLPPEENTQTGERGCTVCNLRFKVKWDEGVPVHDWKRQVFVGTQAIPAPTTGSVRLAPGAIPVGER